MNIISEPLAIYCQPADDMLPHPEACLITGITPQIALDEGLPEAEFIKQIHDELSIPGTCGLGYNTLRFDDEVTRNCLYRNFYDPYAREWQNSNSRWDIIDLTRMTFALRPEGINWPFYENGVPCFKLERLTIENGIEHDAAHDALSDVMATIAWGQLLKVKQPRLYDYLFNLRNKHQVAKLLNIRQAQPVVHVSSKYPSGRHCLAVVMPVALDPKNNNAIIVFDLSQDAELLLDLSPEEIRRRVFTSATDLPEGEDRIALKAVHINKCPALATLNALRPKDQERLDINLKLCEKNFNLLSGNKKLNEKIQQVFTRDDFEVGDDPDLMIYSGGFFDNRDKAKISEVRSSSPEALVNRDFGFNDSRLDEMLFRYRARNFNDTLNPEELLQWKKYCQQRLTTDNGGGSITIEEFEEKIVQLRKELKEQNTNVEERLRILDDLLQYSDKLKKKHQLNDYIL